MKRIWIICLAALLCGCTASVSEQGSASEAGGQEMTEGLEFTKDTQFGRLTLRWTVPEGSCVSEIAVIKDNGNVLYTYQTNDTYQNAGQLLGYACQENNWYGDAAFTVTVRDRNTKKKLSEYRTETFPSAEWYPEAETIDVSGRTLKSFSWNRESPTSYVERLSDVLHSFSLYTYPQKPAKFYAVYYNDSGKQKEIEKELSDADLQKLLGYLSGGILKKDHISDPELVLLDGPNPESMKAVYEEGNTLEKNWYSYVMDTSSKAALLEAVKTYCRTGKWPS